MGATCPREFAVPGGTAGRAEQPHPKIADAEPGQKEAGGHRPQAVPAPPDTEQAGPAPLENFCFAKEGGPEGPPSFARIHRRRLIKVIH